MAKKRNKYLNTYFLLGALAVIVAVFFGVNYWQDKKEDTRYNFFENINLDQVSKIEIISLGESQRLLKNDDGWVVENENNFQAEQAFVTLILDNLKQVNGVEYASSKSEKRGVFEVNEENGIHVRLYEGEDAVVDFFVGKIGPGYKGNYVRKNNDEKTYLTSVSLQNSLLKDDFRDLSVLDIDSSKVTKVALEKNGQGVINLEKADDVWKVKEQDADDAKVASWIGNLAVLRASDVVSEFLGEDYLKIIITGEKEVEIMIKKHENKYLAKTSEDVIIYELSEASIFGLDKEIDDFLSLN